MSRRFFKSLRAVISSALPTRFFCLYGILVGFNLETTCVGQTLMRLNPATNRPTGLHVSYLDSPVPCKSSAHAPPDPKTQPASKEEVPVGDWKHPCCMCVFWRYIVIRLFTRDVDEDSDKFSATCPSFRVAQGTYYWNPQKYQKQSRGPVISSIVARVYSVHLGTISESCGNSQASVSFVYPEVEEVLNRSSTLLFMKGSPEMPRCRFSRLATWRQWRRISTMEMLQYLSICWGYLGFTGEYGEPRPGQEFQWIS